MSRAPVILAILAGLAPFAATPGHASWTIDDLLEKFRGMPGLEARFREEKTISLLAVPLISEGTLHFAPPARLVRHTVTPSRSTLLIDTDRLMFGDGSDREEIDLGTNPVVRDYVASFLLLLEGDREALAGVWRMELTGEREKWQLTLHPISESIAQSIHEMTLRGRGAVIDWMKITETTGDESVTTFSEVNPERRYEPAEIDRIFRIPPDRE